MNPPPPPEIPNPAMCILTYFVTEKTVSYLSAESLISFIAVFRGTSTCVQLWCNKYHGYVWNTLSQNIHTNTHTLSRSQTHKHPLPLPPISPSLYQPPFPTPTHINTHVHTHIHTHTCTHAHTHTHMYTHTCTHTHTYTCTHTHTVCLPHGSRPPCSHPSAV